MTTISHKVEGFYAEQTTEQHRTVNADRTITTEELPGSFEIGVVIGGAKVPIFKTPKAAQVLKRIARAEAAATTATTDS